MEERSLKERLRDTAWVHRWFDQAGYEAAAEIETLESEVERLRNALKIVCSNIHLGDDGPNETWADFTGEETDQIFAAMMTEK